MKVLVIPDVHLKPQIFDGASQLMNNKIADRAVCLMDLADDWNQQLNIDLYRETYDRAIAFAKEFPDTLWCYGNHDIYYIWDLSAPGFSLPAQPTVCEKLRILRESLPDPRQLAFLHRIDAVVFSHGGLSDEFVRQTVPVELYHDIDAVLKTINALSAQEFYYEFSPIWYRPQYHKEKLYKPETLLQVVGHTPVKRIEKSGNLISCDVFSTYRNGTPVGTQEYLILDTVSWQFIGAAREE